jgi:AAA15 family ATPase/GTPase
MMKLLKFKVTNFRSVQDSGWIDCGDVTSLVGINEAGKSNLILALWKLKPVRDEGESKIGLLHDLPNKHYAAWRDKAAEYQFITACFELDDEIKKKIIGICGCNDRVASTEYIL